MTQSTPIIPNIHFVHRPGHSDYPYTHADFDPSTPKLGGYSIGFVVHPTAVSLVVAFCRPDEQFNRAIGREIIRDIFDSQTEREVTIEIDELAPKIFSSQVHTHVLHVGFLRQLVVQYVERNLARLRQRASHGL